MAASILSFGMLTARAFWMVRRNMGFAAGSGPPAFTAMVMSFAMRANCFAMRFHRANIVCFRTSKMRPIVYWLKWPAALANIARGKRRRWAQYRTRALGADSLNCPRERAGAQLPDEAQASWA